MGPKDSGSSSWDPRGAEGTLALRPDPVEVRGGLAESLPVRDGSPLTPAPTPSTLRSRRAPAPPTQGQEGAPLLSLKPGAGQLSAHAAGQAGLEVTPPPTSALRDPHPPLSPFGVTADRVLGGATQKCPPRPWTPPVSQGRRAICPFGDTFHLPRGRTIFSKKWTVPPRGGTRRVRPPRPPPGSQSAARSGSSGNAGSQWALPARAGRLSGPWTPPSLPSAGAWSPTRPRNAADPESGLSGGGAPTLSVRSSLPLTPLHTRAGAAV